MFWAWMHWLPHTLAIRNTNIIIVWAWMLWLSHALGTRTLFWFGHGCSSYPMLWEHERYYGLGMDALVIACARNTNITMVWAWMLWLSHALGTRTLLWFGHGCSGYRMLLEQEACYDFAAHPESQVCFFLRVYAPAELVTIVIHIITMIVIMVVAIIVSMSEGSLGSDTGHAIIFSTPTRPLHRVASRSKKPLTLPLNTTPATLNRNPKP